MILVYRTWKSEHWSDAQRLCNARVIFISSLTDCYCSFLTVSPWQGAHGFVRRQPLLWRSQLIWKFFFCPETCFSGICVLYMYVYIWQPFLPSRSTLFKIDPSLQVVFEIYEANPLPSSAFICSQHPSYVMKPLTTWSFPPGFLGFDGSVFVKVNEPNQL